MPQFENAPIQRHESLAPFSRDHYGGLVQARRLIKAAGDDDVARRKVLCEFVDAWDREIAGHFRDEQRLLLDVMSEDDRERLLREHRQLTDFAARARELRRQTDPDAETLKQIGEALERHIRWEERELFARLQDQLDSEQLAAIGHRTAEIEASRPRNACRDGGEGQSST
jgi:hypothetical protein